MFGRRETEGEFFSGIFIWKEEARILWIGVYGNNGVANEFLLLYSPDAVLVRLNAMTKLPPISYSNFIITRLV